MKFENADFLQQSTAIHEAGHALICLIHDYAIKSWSVVSAEPNTLGIVNTCFISCPDKSIKFSLAGPAAERQPIFWKRRELPIPKNVLPDTDVEYAVESIGVLLDRDPSHMQIQRLNTMVWNVYREIKNTMCAYCFRASVLALAKDMSDIEKMDDNGAQGSINRHMWDVLRKEGIGKAEKARMRACMDKIRCADILKKSL